MARRVKQADPDLADPENFVALVRHEARTTDAGRALDPRRLELLHVNRDLDQLEELGDARYVVADEIAADVIGVVVGGEHTGEAHAVGLEDTDDLTWRVGGVDRDGVAALTVADEVDEVHHLAGERVTRCDVEPGQKLAEVKAFVGHGSSGSGDQFASFASRGSFEKTSTMGSRRPMRRWSRSMASSWSHKTSVTATPPSPARAVRPDR